MACKATPLLQRLYCQRNSFGRLFAARGEALVNELSLQSSWKLIFLLTVSTLLPPSTDRVLICRMGLTPLPPCTRATDHSLLDDSWNNSHRRWIPATVWAAQYAAHAAEQTKRSPQGLQRCAACAADIAAAAKPVCSKCKMVSLDMYLAMTYDQGASK